MSTSAPACLSVCCVVYLPKMATTLVIQEEYSLSLFLTFTISNFLVCYSICTQILILFGQQWLLACCNCTASQMSSASREGGIDPVTTAAKSVSFYQIWFEINVMTSVSVSYFHSNYNMLTSLFCLSWN